MSFSEVHTESPDILLAEVLELPVDGSVVDGFRFNISEGAISVIKEDKDNNMGYERAKQADEEEIEPADTLGIDSDGIRQMRAVPSRELRSNPFKDQSPDDE